MPYRPGEAVDLQGDVLMASEEGTVWRVGMESTPAIRVTNLTTGVETLLGATVPAHTHDDRYYTEAEVDGLLAGYQGADPFLADIAALTDPGADRILFWDDSVGELAWLTVGAGLAIAGDTISATAGGGSDYYATMTDGVTSAAASGSDTFKFRSANAAITVAVANDDATHGDNLLLTFNQAAITITESQISDLGPYADAVHDHDLADLTDAGSGTGTGLLVVATALGADTIAAPSAAGQVLKSTSSGIGAGYEWGDVTTGVTSITAGDALDGGGAGSVTLNVNPYSGIAANRGQTVIEADAIAVVLGTTGNTAAAGNHTHSVGDVSGAVATTRALTAGSGLTGGGDLSADRTFNVGAGTGIAVAADSVGLTGQALALHNLASLGLIARTGAGTVAARTVVAGSGIAVTNGNGQAGNPTVAVDADVVIVTVSGAAPGGTPSRAGDMWVVI